MTTSAAALTPEESNYPLPSQAEVIIVTPEMASDWATSRRWPGQRTVSPTVTSKYRRDMAEGRWKLTRQGLVFNTEGWQFDGGHRMRALANIPRETLEEQYGMPGIPFWVYPDEPVDTFDAYDQTFKRQASHLTRKKNATTLMAGARFLNAALDQDPYGFPRLGQLTTPEVLATERDWPELDRYTSLVHGLQMSVKIHPAPHLAVLAQASRTEHGTPEKIQEWLEGLKEGVVSSARDPRLKLRDRFLQQHHMMRGAGNRPLVYSLIAKSWNAFALDEEINMLVWRGSGPAAARIPTIVGFDPKPTEENK